MLETKFIAGGSNDLITVESERYGITIRVEYEEDEKPPASFSLTTLDARLLHDVLMLHIHEVEL